MPKSEQYKQSKNIASLEESQQAEDFKQRATFLNHQR